MKKEQKEIVIANLGAQLKEFPHFYLIDVAGMNAEATSSFRRKCFKSNVKMVVVKNTLLHRVLEDAEADYSELYGSLKGSTAVLFSAVANEPAKLLSDKDIKKAGVPSLKAAYAEECAYVGADKLAELVAIKSKNELIADVVALLQSPAKNVVSALQSGANTIHGVLKTLGERPE